MQGMLKGLTTTNLALCKTTDPQTDPPGLDPYNVGNVRGMDTVPQIANKPM